jgi:uncharacterized membrane protein (DUF4010 family)
MARAVELTGLFGGLVNSTVTVAALASRVRDNPILVKSAYRGILPATAAMLFRNGVLLAILAPRASATAAIPLAVMLIACALLVVRRGKPSNPGSELGGLPLQSPFSLSSAVRFGLLFLALKVAGTLSQWWLGQFGFYAVSLAGSLVSSASAVASAAALASQGTLTPAVAGTGAIIASLASALVNLPLVARIGRDRPLTQRVGTALALILLLGIVTAVCTPMLLRLVAPTLFAWPDFKS